METIPEIVWPPVNRFLANYSKLAISVGNTSLVDFTEIEALILKNTYQTNHIRKPIKIAELGCWTGKTTLCLAEIAKQLDGHVVAIDDFSGRSLDILIENARIFNIETLFKETIKENLYEDYVTLHKGEAETIADRYAEEYFDVVYVDTSYRYDNMKVVLDAWYPKVKTNGIICGCNVDTILNDEFKAKMKDSSFEYLVKYFPGVDVAISEKFKNVKKTATGAIWYSKKTLKNS